MTAAFQLNMFGPPEAIDALDPQARLRDDAPVPCERELLWPHPHADILGPELLERLYGDIPRRTRLTVWEVCRRIRCGHSHVYNLIECGSLDATDTRHPDAIRPSYAIYRASLVRFLFSREFLQDATRAGLSAADMQRIDQLVTNLQKERKPA